LKRQDLPKLGVFLQNLVKIFLVLLEGPKLRLLLQNVAKSRAFPTKCGQNISSSVGGTKIRAFPAKSGQDISSSVGGTKNRAFPTKSG
jgi:hypothetical protein